LSSDLFSGQRLVIILHEQDDYRLQMSAAGKPILTSRAGAFGLPANWAERHKAQAKPSFPSRQPLLSGISQPSRRPHDGPRKGAGNAYKIADSVDATGIRGLATQRQ
jgi:Hemin uptake protein hemP